MDCTDVACFLASWLARWPAAALPCVSQLAPHHQPLLLPPPLLQVNLGSLQQQLAALALGAGGGERISPTLDAILDLLEEAPADDAAAAAEAFVAQAAEGASTSSGAAGGAAMGGEAEGGEAAESEAAMEGVVAEYAYAGAPDLADAPGLAGALARECKWACVLGSWAAVANCRVVLLLHMPLPACCGSAGACPTIS